IMKQYYLPTDEIRGHSWGGIPPREMHFIFDGVTTIGNDVFHTLPVTSLPQHFTFDMGKTAKLSRFKLWQRSTAAMEHAFTGTAVKHFKLYGSNNPNPDGSFDESWTLIGDYTMIKPSGLPRNELSNDDLLEIRNG